MQNVNARKVRHSLLRIHCEDAAFLFELREKAIDAPNYRIIDVYDIDERLRGHTSALLLADDAGAAITADVLAETQGHGEIAVATYVVANRTGGRGLAAFLDRWDPELQHRQALVWALSWCRPDLLSTFMSDWIASSDPRLVAIAFGICAETRIDPRGHLVRAMQHSDPGVLSAALHVAGVCGRDDLCSAAVDRLGESGAVGREAAFAGVLLGDRTRAPQALIHQVADDPTGAWSRLAAELAPLGLKREEAQNLVRNLVYVPETARWGIVSTGVLGGSASLDWLVRKMADPLLARVAGEAFGRITGANLKNPDLELKEFPDDPEDQITAENPAEAFYEGNLPWPDANGVQRWLNANRSRFAPDRRHLMGLPAWSLDSADLRKQRFQSQMRALSFELALRQPGAPLPNWRAPVRLQAGVLGRTW